jgi:hypothetical protein
MASYWFKSRQINVNCSRFYDSEARMRAAAIKMLRKRARDANAELYVYSKWGPYSGPDEDSCLGYAAFAHDAETVKWIPAATYK